MWMLDRFTGTAEKKALLGRDGASQSSRWTLKRSPRPSCYLASDKASFITGASYVIDRGKTAR